MAVDNFQSAYGPCTEVAGALTIEGTDITDLSGLSGLTKVASLAIENCPNLSHLDGLASLHTIDGGVLSLDNLPQLTNINGLSGLIDVHVGVLRLRDLPILADISVLSGIPNASIAASGLLGIGNVDAITTADLSNFSIPDLRVFNVFANDALTSLSIPGFITFDGRGCFVWDNPNLQTVDLSGLTTVTDELRQGLFFRSNALTNLDLSSLRNVSGLRVEEEYFLSDLSTLSNLESIIGSGMILSNVPLLTDINWLSNLTAFDGFYLKLNNLPLVLDIQPLIQLATPSIAIGGEFGLVNLESVTTADLSNFSAPEISQFGILDNDALTNFALPGFIAFEGRNCIVWDNPNLENLDLSGLTTVNDLIGGGIFIRSNALSTVDLSNLISTNGLHIENEPILSDLSSLSKLETLTGKGLLLVNIPNLSDLDWLSSLTTFDGHFLKLNDLPLIPDIQPLTQLSAPSITQGGEFGLVNLESVTTADLSNFSVPELRAFGVFDNDALTYFALPGFIALDGRTCIVWDNPNLHTVDLSGLTTVTDELLQGLFFRSNALNNLDLSNLTTVSGLRIEQEPVLSSLDGLPKLISVGSYLRISDNPNLCDCAAISPLVDSQDDDAAGPGSGAIPDIGGPVIIGNNLPGCNTIDEIISGLFANLTCYLDSDGDTFGDPLSPEVFCSTCGDGYVTNDLDCDDSDDQIHPGAEERCDGVDNNCDGVIDENLLPAITQITTPSDPKPTGATITVEATFDDENDQNGHSAEWNWGDGTALQVGVEEVDQIANTVIGTHVYSVPGVYTVTLTVTDACGDQDSKSSVSYVVIYDPSAGFVTGGGWIQSPAGAYVDAPGLTGKANFGFVSKYLPGQSKPSGNTQFHFNAAGFKFKSTDYDWLTIAGPNAKFKGSGKVNNQGTYGFMLTAIDGQINGGGGIDKFRIKIWDKDDNDRIVYDNKMNADDLGYDTQELGSGSITIHKNGPGSNRISATGGVLQPSSDFSAFPNPFTREVQLSFSARNKGPARITIFSAQGILVRTLNLATVDSGSYQVTWDGRGEQGELLPKGVYIARLDLAEERAFQQLVLIR